MSKHRPFKFTIPASATLASVTPGTAYKVAPMPNDETGDLLVTVWPRKAPESAAITFTSHVKDDEGYHATETTVIQRASDDEWDMVFNEDGRDCDGRMSRQWLGRGDGKLRKGNAWSEMREINASQRDYQAEAAGY